MNGEDITGVQALLIMSQVGVERVEEFSTYEQVTLRRGAVIRHFREGKECRWQLDPTNYQSGGSKS